MKKILAFNGSPRPAGNTVHLLHAFTEGCRENGIDPEVFPSHGLHIKECMGCLRCNVLKRCSLSGDDWATMARRILEADVLVFAAPVYFHHLPASMKLVLDRFRSFTHVQVTEKGLIHSPHQVWKKEFVLILAQGSPDPSDARPIEDLFKYICSIMGRGNRLSVIRATGLSTVNQVVKTEKELSLLYKKLGMPEKLVPKHHQKNRLFLESCFQLGQRLSKK